MSRAIIRHQALAVLALVVCAAATWWANTAVAATPQPAAATTSHAAAMPSSPAVTASHTAATTSRAAAGKRSAPAQPPIHAIEQALEVTMDQLRLPDGATGPVLIDPCARCQAKSLTLDAHSLIYLDDKVVSLVTLRLRLKQRANLIATALYAPADMRLTRLLVISR